MVEIACIQPKNLGYAEELWSTRLLSEVLRAAETRIRVVLDNHSAHTSKETMAWLAGHSGRFEFIFTPKHGSWLNIIETFFAKMTRQMLRGIRVTSREDLKQRIEIYLEQLNEHRWSSGGSMVWRH